MADRHQYAKAGHGEKQREAIAKAYPHYAGNISAIARALGITRATVYCHIRKMGGIKKPLAGGSRTGTKVKTAGLPSKGSIKRYILTSAQNNTHVNKEVWFSLNMLADHYEAQLLVGTFSYNQNNYGPLAVKQGTRKRTGPELWFDEALSSNIRDSRIEIAPGLVWCGEMNILPTAENPFSGLETYTQRKSSIFPHVKLGMRSVATMQGEGTKLMYTTGTVTQMNYIQKKDGLKAEHHHVYGGLLVEVNENGNWWVRQLHATVNGEIQDLDVKVVNGLVTTGNKIEAITWGDLHATMVEDWVVDASMDMLDSLKPSYQFLHDLMEGTSINRHVISKGPDPHYTFHRWLRGYHRVDEELKATAAVVTRYLRPWCKTIAPDANHDDWWFKSWLARYDYRFDPANAELFLELQQWVYKQIREGKMSRDVSVVEYALSKFGLDGVKFLVSDEPFTICNGKIECGMHGHLGPNGARGTPENLNRVGRRANTAHTHSAGIYNGLYVAGTSSKFKWTYNMGPSSWSHSHIVTYPNGTRTIVTMYAGKWRA